MTGAARYAKPSWVSPQVLSRSPLACLQAAADAAADAAAAEGPPAAQVTRFQVRIELVKNYLARLLHQGVSLRHAGCLCVTHQSQKGHEMLHGCTLAYCSLVCNFTWVFICVINFRLLLPTFKHKYMYFLFCTLQIRAWYYCV